MSTTRNRGVPPPAQEPPSPFRAPGLPVDAPRREAAAVRVLRVGWASARAAIADGAASLREAPSPRLAFGVEVARAVNHVLRSAIQGALALGLLWLALAGFRLWLAEPGDESVRALMESALMLVAGAAAVGAVAVVAVIVAGAVGAARILLDTALIVLTAAASAALRFVGAAVREVGREVARQAYDAEVARAHTRVRVAAEAGREDADGDARVEGRAQAARRAVGPQGR